MTKRIADQLWQQIAYATVSAFERSQRAQWCEHCAAYGPMGHRHQTSD
jgi:hypothetical protein